MLENFSDIARFAFIFIFRYYTVKFILKWKQEKNNTIMIKLNGRWVTVYINSCWKKKKKMLPTFLKLHNLK